MSQYDFGNLESPVSGTELINTHLEPWRNAVHSLHSGASRPSYAVAGMQWINTTTNPWVLNIFDGSDDIPLGTINTSTNAFTPSNVAPATGSVTNAMLATVAANSVKANNTGSTASPSDVTMNASTILARLASGNIVAATVAQIKTLLAIVVADISDAGSAALATIGTAGATLGLLNTTNAYSAAQRGVPVSLTQAATIAVNLALGNNFYTVMTGNRTLGAPSNVVAGQSGAIELNQDATGTRTITFNAAWKFPAGADKVLATGANARNTLFYYTCQDGTVHASLNKGFV